MQTATAGATWAISSFAANDFRFNFSRTSTSSSHQQDAFGGATPLTSLPFPSPFSAANGFIDFRILSLRQGEERIGYFQRNLQRQINVVDSLTLQKGTHSLKVGADFRRLTPLYDPFAYGEMAGFLNVANAKNGSLLFSTIGSNLKATFLFRNLGIYAQDTWRVVPRITVTYGLRWDVDFVVQSIDGPSFPAATGFNLTDLSRLAVAPAGTAPYKTTYRNFAPRLGAAYELQQRQGWQTELRGGFGVFYDLATSEMGSNIGIEAYPFGSFVATSGGTFPLSPAASNPAPISVAGLGSSGGVFPAFDPNLELPYTLQWNVALEQALGAQQTISASYVGAAGRRLLQTAEVLSPNANIRQAQLVTNAGTSDYDALQLQFRRRLARGVQALASYTWAHSIDTGSAGSNRVVSNSLQPAVIGGSSRGPSDFDVRNAFSAGATYDLPTPKVSQLAKAILGQWSLQNVVQVRSAVPVSIVDTSISQFNNGFEGGIRPDLVPGQPLYLFGSQCLQAPPAGFGQPCPGGKGFNPNAFAHPPVDPVTHNPLRQGNAPRNLLRGFGAAQWDLAVHRSFPIHESLNLQFRAEMFNVLNHPNLGQPSGAFGRAGFGLSSAMLAQGLNNQNLGGGALSPLYQIGGPRSVEFALKLTF